MVLFLKASASAVNVSASVRSGHAVKPYTRTQNHTIRAATEWGSGMGPNGTGRREKVSGFYVIDRAGRKIRAFVGKGAEVEASAWAKHCDEHF